MRSAENKRPVQLSVSQQTGLLQHNKLLIDYNIDDKIEKEREEKKFSDELKTKLANANAPPALARTLKTALSLSTAEKNQFIFCIRRVVAQKSLALCAVDFNITLPMSSQD